MVTPRDFPTMTNPAVAVHLDRSARRAGKPAGRPWVRCSVCGLTTDPRNSNRHRRACARRKREAPDLWRDWQQDMQAHSRDLIQRWKGVPR